MIDQNAKRQVAIGDDFALSVRYGDVQPLNLQTSGKYTLIVESYEAPLVLWLSEVALPWL